MNEQAYMCVYVLYQANMYVYQFKLYFIEDRANPTFTQHNAYLSIYIFVCIPNKYINLFERYGIYNNLVWVVVCGQIIADIM